MISFVQLVLIVLVFVAVVLAGIWLAQVTKEELKGGRRYFRILMKLCLLFIGIFLVYWFVSGSDEIFIAVLGLAALAVLSFISLKKSLKKSLKTKG